MSPAELDILRAELARVIAVYGPYSSYWPSLTVARLLEEIAVLRARLARLTSHLEAIGSLPPAAPWAMNEEEIPS